MNPKIAEVVADARAKAEYMRLQGMYRAQEEWEEFADRLEQAIAALSGDKDGDRLDFLEDTKRTYLIKIYTQPSGDCIYDSFGEGLRAVIDAAIKESGA